MTRTRLIAFAADAPAAVGPYTQAVKVGDLLFASGSLGLDPAVGKMVRAPLRRNSTRC